VICAYSPTATQADYCATSASTVTLVRIGGTCHADWRPARITTAVRALRWQTVGNWESWPAMQAWLARLGPGAAGAPRWRAAPGPATARLAPLRHAPRPADGAPAWSALPPPPAL